MNNQGRRKDFTKRLHKIGLDVKSSSEAKKKLNVGLLDTQTSLTLHKNLIINLIKECVAKAVIPYNEANPNTELTDNLASLLIAKSSNDLFVDRFTTCLLEKLKFNKSYCKINHCIDFKSKKQKSSTIYYKDMCSRLEHKLLEKKTELENKVKEHDKYIANSTAVFKGENYIHYPTKYNLELYTEKTQSIEIMEKLSEIMKSEKAKYNSYQDKIKGLINRISEIKKQTSCKTIKTLIDESFSTNKDQYNSYNNAQSQIKIDTLGTVEEEDTGQDDLDLNSKLDITFDSHYLRFPDKVKKLNLEIDADKDLAIGEIPKLNFENIHTKYKNDKNVIIKEDKKANNNNLKEANDIILNLMDDERKTDYEVEQFKKAVITAEKRVHDLKNQLNGLNSTYKLSKQKGQRMSESISNTSIKINKLMTEIEEMRKGIREVKNTPKLSRLPEEKVVIIEANSNILICEQIEKGKSTGLGKEFEDEEEEKSEDEDDEEESFDEVNFDVFDFDKKNRPSGVNKNDIRKKMQINKLKEGLNE